MNAILHLVRARLARRRGHALLVTAAVTAAVALVGTILGIGSVSGDLALARTLAGLPEGERAVRVSTFVPSGRDLGRLDREARDALALLGEFGEPPVRGLLSRPLRDRAARFELRLVALDEPGRWTRLSEGRQPQACDGARCEAILLSEAPVPDAIRAGVRFGELELRIVGRGTLTSALPLGALHQSGPEQGPPSPLGFAEDPAAAILLVRGVDAAATGKGAGEIGRTQFWTAPLDPAVIHPWSVTELRRRVSLVDQRLAATEDELTSSAPLAPIEVELARDRAAAARLLLLSSLAAAVLLAFAAFAALVGRADVLAERSRLVAFGARRGQIGSFLAVEAIAPAICGGALGVILAAFGVAALAAVEGVPVVASVMDSVLSVTGIAGLALVIVAAAFAILLPTLPLAGRRIYGILPVVAATALGLIGWQLVAEGALDPARLAGTIASPVVVILPPLVAFLVALCLLALLPFCFRWLARRTARAPLSLRFSILAVARDPERPAATLTLLCFSLGMIVFAAGYGASLRQGIADQAAYQAGMDLRVRELPTGLTFSSSVVPLDRYAALPADVERTPVLRHRGDTVTGAPVELVGLPAESVARLRGWRSDFSTLSVDELGRRIAAPGDWTLRGQPVPANAGQLALDISVEGDPILLTAVVATPRGDFVTLSYGRVAPGRRVVRQPLPEEAAGGTVIAVRLNKDTESTGFHGGAVRSTNRAVVDLPGLPEVVGDEPLRLEFTNAQPSLTFRAPQPTDGITIPAIVSPDLAATADSAGRLTVRLGDDGALDLRISGIARYFPTLEASAPRFAIADLEPLATAINADQPGSAFPDELWIRAPDERRAAEVASAIERGPFRRPEVISRAALESQRASDPLAAAVIWALVLAALTGIALAVVGLLVGAAADVRDERGELADLEAQGMAPAALRRQAIARTGWLTGGGIVAGLGAGVALTIVLTSALALSAGAALPIPPLVPVLPWLPVAAVVIALVVTVGGLVALLARRAFAAERLGRREIRG
ncbi:MAG TPA: FtsX-like permease family protein [Candidatus Limnocylindrales bacterium]|jgi:hypothetical protein|nr:FtsX-like permease family protein [Candidatus Limnocylindrales bacterium]